MISIFLHSHLVQFLDPQNHIKYAVTEIFGWKIYGNSANIFLLVVFSYGKTKPANRILSCPDDFPSCSRKNISPTLRYKMPSKPYMADCQSTGRQKRAAPLPPQQRPLCYRLFNYRSRRSPRTVKLAPPNFRLLPPQKFPVRHVGMFENRFR